MSIAIVINYTIPIATTINNAGDLYVQTELVLSLCCLELLGPLEVLDVWQWLSHRGKPVTTRPV